MVTTIVLDYRLTLPLRVHDVDEENVREDIRVEDKAPVDSNIAVNFDADADRSPGDASITHRKLWYYIYCGFIASSELMGDSMDL